MLDPKIKTVEFTKYAEWKDVMGYAERWEIPIGQHGLVALVDVMPRLVPEGRGADFAVVRAARTSTGGAGLKTPAEDRALIRYLMRHEHYTPFEFVQMTFYMVLPIFVARQWVRHRSCAINEYSLRYSEPKDRFWIPDPSELRQQSTSNKQGGEMPVNLEAAQTFVGDLEVASGTAIRRYRDANDAGMSRELARTILPVNTMTEWYWTSNLRMILHLLGLRQDSHAQKEIRDYADAMYTLIKPIVPDVIEAYDQYDVHRGGMALSSLDIEAMTPPDTGSTPQRIAEIFPNKREREEFARKMDRLGFPVWAEQARAVVNDSE